MELGFQGGGQNSAFVTSFVLILPLMGEALYRKEIISKSSALSFSFYKCFFLHVAVENPNQFVFTLSSKIRLYFCRKANTLSDQVCL